MNYNIRILKCVIFAIVISFILTNTCIGMTRKAFTKRRLGKIPEGYGIVKRFKVDETNDKDSLFRLVTDDILLIILAFACTTVSTYATICRVCKHWRKLGDISNRFISWNLFMAKDLFWNGDGNISVVSRMWNLCKGKSDKNNGIIWTDPKVYRSKNKNGLKMTDTIMHDICPPLWGIVAKDDEKKYKDKTGKNVLPMYSESVADSGNGSRLLGTFNKVTRTELEMDFVTNIKLILEPYGLGTFHIDQLIMSDYYKLMDWDNSSYTPAPCEEKYISFFKCRHTMLVMTDYFIEEDDTRCFSVMWHNGTNGIVMWIVLLRLKRILEMLGVSCRLDCSEAASGPKYNLNIVTIRVPKQKVTTEMKKRLEVIENNHGVLFEVAPMMRYIVTDTLTMKTITMHNQVRVTTTLLSYEPHNINTYTTGKTSDWLFYIHLEKRNGKSTPNYDQTHKLIMWELSQRTEYSYKPEREAEDKVWDIIKNRRIYHNDMEERIHNYNKNNPNDPIVYV